MNAKTMKEYDPVVISDYVPTVVKRLISKIENEEFQQLAFYGFGDNMKWLYRIFKEKGVEPKLFDWRVKFQQYDCGGKTILPVDSIEQSKHTLLVLCSDTVDVMKESIIYLYDNDITEVKTVYDLGERYSPFHFQEPYKSISIRAKKRAKSMISDAQLFDLIQYIQQTRSVPGDVVEYGSLHGGSGAVLAEALVEFGTKPLWLFDSFQGIPKSKYGLDHHWNGSFSNNSYAEVADAFSDLKNVNVVNGNICETYDKVKNPISFGYLASDSFETGEILLGFMWSRLSPGGIICICDYGSFPNCLPLTALVDNFLREKDAFVYYPDDVGIMIRKSEKE